VKLKLDENLSRHLAPALTAFGHDVDTVADEGLLGESDNAVPVAAIQADRLLLTVDLDFSDIRRFPPGTHPGIIVFRPRGAAGPLEINRFVESFIRTNIIEEFAGCLVVVDPTKTRVRTLTDQPEEES